MFFQKYNSESLTEYTGLLFTPLNNTTLKRHQPVTTGATNASLVCNSKVFTVPLFNNVKRGKIHFNDIVSWTQYIKTIISPCNLCKFLKRYFALLFPAQSPQSQCVFHTRHISAKVPHPQAQQPRVASGDGCEPPFESVQPTESRHTYATVHAPPS